MTKEIELTHDEVLQKVKNREEPQLFKGMSFNEFLQAKKVKDSQTKNKK